MANSKEKDEIRTTKKDEEQVKTAPEPPKSTETLEKVEQSKSPESLEIEEQPESPEKPESLEKPESPEKAESPESPEKAESPESPASPESLETPEKKKTTKGWKFISTYVIVNIFRFILGLTLLFSAFVKANDPVGFHLKLKDYALAIGMTEVPKFLLILICIILVAIEATLGIYIFVGVKRRKRIAGLIMLFMAAMTLITVWLFVENPISDCGCFGDAVKLTNGQSLTKNIILLLMALVCTIKNKMMFRLIHKNWNWILTIPVVASMVVFTTYSEYMLPTVDFLPFAENTDLKKTVATGNGLDLRFKTTIIYKRGDETLKLTPEDEDPDSTWTYVETKSEVLEDNLEGTTQFYVMDSDGDDVTQELLDREGYSFLVTVPDFSHLLESIGGKFNRIYDYTKEFDYGFYFIIGTENADEELKDKWINNTGAKYPFYESEESMLWQMVRDNPGLMLIKDGVVMKKWSQFNLPFFDYKTPLDKVEMQEIIKAKRFAVKPWDFTTE